MEIPTAEQRKRTLESMRRTRETEESLGVKKHPFKGFDKSRGYTTDQMLNAAIESQHEDRTSHDPYYQDSQKNRS